MQPVRPSDIEAYRYLLKYLVQTLRFTKRFKRSICGNVTERDLIEMHKGIRK